MDGLVTASADYEGFAPPGRHDAYPEWLLGPSLRLQVSKFPHMMDCTMGWWMHRGHTRLSAVG